ncbi:kinesin-domain-containing protein, partial [Metschnikowia bicuspidata]
MSDNIQVVVRCRARNQKEVDARSPSIVVLPDPVFSRDSPYISVNVCPDSNSSNAISGLHAGLHKSQKRFTVDQVYGPGADQALLFEKVAFPLFQDFLQGTNVTILAYGQTGSGKTHTMCGDLAGDGAGIIPRILTRLFDSLGPDSMVKMSCIELYKEELRDLADDALGLASVKTKLRLVPDLARDATAPKIQNLCELPVDSAEMALKVVEKCLGKRRVAATKLNDLSSRSHAILSLTLYQELPSTLGNPQVRISRMNLVDLAGSEDVNKSGAVNERAREAGSINQSLLALGKVINCLSEGKDPKHVPYRESKLTRLLQGLLGGNTKTVLIATVSPAQINASETFSTLNYASKAKNIKNLPQLIQDSELVLKRVLLGDLSRHIARLTRDM